MMRQDEEGASIRPAERYLQGTFGHIDAADFLASGSVDEDLAVGDIDTLAWPPLNEAIAVERVREAQAAMVRRPLRENPPGGQDHAAVGWHIIPRVAPCHIAGEHLDEGGELIGGGVDLILELAIIPPVDR
ncbi:hypothetical protein V473_20545 [Sphingobium cupriresistens LL01]|uniref:Uncharacterized protein n=1 Tax=Sphingobium cupriresistens LL01 TaxID=1420583 RepID=A0A0J7XQR5_9SPHN|nr:hypothetical protein V473_20545 [Sphingobium cupriresistens LL01]